MILVRLPVSLSIPDLEASLGDTPYRTEFVKLSPRIHPRGGYRILGFSSDEESVTIEGVTVLSRDLARHLRGATRVAVMALTLGEEVDEAIEDAKDAKDPRRAFLLDAIASAAAEGAAEALSEALRREGEAGDRYSPGYGDWSVRDNEHFARWLDLEALGIKVLPSGALLPRKSITALAGFGATGESPCRTCPLERCVYPCPRP